MENLTPKEKLEMISAIKIVKEGSMAVVFRLFETQKKLDEVQNQLVELSKKIGTFEDVHYVNDGKDGKDGSNYILTEADKQEIAQSVIIPTIEVPRIIEKTEVIKEQPVVTEITKEVKIENPVKPIEVRDMLEVLTGDERLDISAIKGIEESNLKLSDVIINKALGVVSHRTEYLITKVSNLQTQVNNISTGTGGLGTILTTAGTIDDSNLNFNFIRQPSLLIINGGIYQQTGGAITWSWSGVTATLSTPVGTGGSIFGL